MDLDSPDTKARIRRVAQDTKTSASTNRNGEGTPDYMSLAGLYRWAQKEGIENAVIWVINKLKLVATHIGGDGCGPSSTKID